MHALRPVFALFIRSLREDSRAKLPTILRAALVSVILLMLWGIQRSFIYQPEPGRQFFMMVMMLNAGFIGVAALSIFPGAIAEEKEDETLPLLRMTNLSALSILFGKSTSRLVSAMLLLAVQIPFTLLAITLGGITFSQIGGAYAILAGTTFFLCNLALLASVFARTTIRAGFLTAFFGAFLYVGVPVAAMYVSFQMGGQRLGQGSSKMETVFGWVIQANPMWALMMLLEAPMMRGMWTNHLYITAIGGAVCFILSWLLFDRYCSHTAEAAPVTRKSRNGRPRRWALVTRAWSRLPLSWKDFHFMIGGRFGMYLRLFLAGLIFALICWFSFETRRQPQTYYRVWEQITMMTLFFAGCCAGTEVVLLTGRIFGAERRRLTLSSLVGLPWTTGKLIRQKIFGCLPVFLPWALLAVVGVLVSWDSILRELARDWDRAEMSFRRNREEYAMVCYVGLQAILLLVLIAWFSLRLRRGALPASAAVLTVWNIIFAICVDEVHSRDEYLVVFVGVFLTIPAVILMMRAVYRRIQIAAAED